MNSLKLHSTIDVTIDGHYQEMPEKIMNKKIIWDDGAQLQIISFNCFVFLFKRWSKKVNKSFLLNKAANKQKLCYKNGFPVNSGKNLQFHRGKKR